MSSRPVFWCGLALLLGSVQAGAAERPFEVIADQPQSPAYRAAAEVLIDPPAYAAAADAGGAASEIRGNFVTMLFEDFEGAFPNGQWNVFADSTAGANTFWNDTSFRSFNGNWSGGAARGGPDAVPAGSNYPDNMRSWAIFGPMNFSDADGGTFSFRHFSETEGNFFDYLFWGVSINGSNFTGFRFSGDSGGWIQESVDLTNVGSLGSVAGQPQVWIAFLFNSDGSISGGEGSYLDDIEVTKTLDGGGGFDLDLQTVDAPAGTFAPGDDITIFNTTRNVGTAASGNYDITFYLSTNQTISGSDTAMHTFTRDPLNAGASHNFNSTVFIPSGTPDGNYYVGAGVNGGDGNPGNDFNHDGTPITVSSGGGGADLDAESIDAPDGTYAPGESFTVSNVTRNIGTSTSAPYTVRFYASTNTTITTSDTELAAYNRDGLGAGATHAFNSEVTLPTSLGDDDYFIGFGVFANDGNPNNDFAHDPDAIQVSSGGEPEISVSPTELEFTAPAALKVKRVESFAPVVAAPFVRGEAMVGASPKRGAIETYAIAVDHAALKQAPAELLLDLPSGMTRATADGFEQRGKGNDVWRGWTDAGGRVVLTQVGRHLTGMIYASDGSYYIHWQPGVGQVLARIDEEGFPPELPPLAVPLQEKSDAPAVPKVDAPGEIQLMAIFTNAARDNAGSNNAVKAEIQNAVDLANTAFIDSDMDARFTLVHSQKTNYAETGDMGDGLEWLAGSNAVANLRDTHNADMVSLIGEYFDSCGLGYVMRDVDPSFESLAFQVTNVDCIPNHSFAHEHGHNMGFEHNPEDSSATSSQASHPWAFGHYHNGDYRSVMSYSNQCSSGCGRVPHFSNPAVNHAGLPTGVSDTRDNHRAGNSNDDTVANFRSSGGQSFVISNTGAGTLTVDELSADASTSNWLSWTPQAPFDIAPGNEQTVFVSVDFAQAPGGDSTTNLTIGSNDANEDPYPGGVDIIVHNTGGGGGGNAPPNTPADPSPADGATDVNNSTVLDFTGGDPDGDSVTYDVYLEAGDATPDTLVCNDSPVSLCTPLGDLSLDTTYFWQVVARDSEGATTTGPIWSFTTEAEDIPADCDAIANPLARLLCLLLNGGG